MSGVQLIEQRAGLLQIERVETFGEPAVDRSEKITRLIPLALLAPEAGEAGGSAKLEQERPLRIGDLKGGAKRALSLFGGETEVAEEQAQKPVDF